MKKIKVYNLLQPLIEGTLDFEKFRIDDFVNDFKAELQKHLPEYDVEFILVDDNNWSLIPNISYVTSEVEVTKVIDQYLAYPMVEGDISDDEKERICDMLWEDPFLTFHADGDYFYSIIGDTTNFYK